MIRIGIAGIGFMGMIHFLAAQQLRGARVAAICSRDPASVPAIGRAFAATSARRRPDDLGGVRSFESFRDLIADPAIDMIDICTPTAQHADMAVAAVQAGKHVLVEKPIALTLRDADRMLSAAKSANRQLLVGHVLPFFPEFALLSGRRQN